MLCAKTGSKRLGAVLTSRRLPFTPHLDVFTFSSPLSSCFLFYSWIWTRRHDTTEQSGQGSRRRTRQGNAWKHGRHLGRITCLFISLFLSCFYFWLALEAHMYRIVVVMVYRLHYSMDYLWVVVTFSKACRLVQDAISRACIERATVRFELHWIVALERKVLLKNDSTDMGNCLQDIVRVRWIERATHKAQVGQQSSRLPAQAITACFG